MSKYAKKIVIRVFRENSWSENRLFMANIRQKKKRHDTINANNSYVIKMEKDRTDGQKIKEYIFL